MNWPKLEPNPYLEFVALGDVRVRGTRIDLSIVVEAFRQGHLAEDIVDQFPSLALEAVYGVIAYYLGHSKTVDRYSALVQKRAEQLRESRPHRLPPAVSTRLRSVRALPKSA
jgi:uncharacterized protein (DUF433 family)